jgi:hypothetical protein
MNCCFRRTSLQESALLRSDVLLHEGNFQVKVDLQPIGGYRGPVGALTLSHKLGASFTTWTLDDIEILSSLVNKVLRVIANRAIPNVLIYGKQDEESFAFHIVPYPKCNLWGKIKGAIDFVSGANRLKNSELIKIERFYQPLVVKECEMPTLVERRARSDVFCRDEVICKQRVAQQVFP